MTVRPSGPVVAFIAWTPIQGRSQEIAKALGGEARCFYHRRLVSRPLVPLRYALSAVGTVGYLLHRRPQAVIATNPPIIPGLISWAYGRLFRRPILLDSHPGGFGAQGDEVSGRLQAAHRFLARRATACMVTDAHWVELLARWGADGMIVHEAPPMWSVEPPKPLERRPLVLFVGTFGGDEPMEVVFEAARACPELDLHVTGDLRRCPPELLEDIPENLTLVGFLGPQGYADAVGSADAILTLSTEPTSVMRAAYEAVYVGRPLVLSDWPGLRKLFPHAIYVENTATGIAAGLRRVVTNHEQLRQTIGAARELQMLRWQEQLDTIRRHTDAKNGRPKGLVVS